MTDNITLFSHILPEEQERMRVCFQAREILYKNNEIIMEYSDSMTSPRRLTALLCPLQIQNTGHVY